MKLLQGDVRTVLTTLPDASMQCCVTSPPYWGLRDYGVDGQLGLERTPEEYVAHMVAVFREVRRVLRDDGTLWLNLGDSYAATPTGNRGTKSTLNGASGDVYAKTLDIYTETKKRRACIPDGLKPKDLVGIPWRVAFALQADGWYLRSDIIWSKPNPMPESVTDRPTKAHEYLFLLSKSPRYYYDAAAIAEPCTQSTMPTRNKRTVWTITTQPYKGAHFAVMPMALVEPCILVGSCEGDTILDPFMGSGTVGVVAKKYGRDFVGIDLNPEYITLAERRIG